MILRGQALVKPLDSHPRGQGNQAPVVSETQVGAVAARVHALVGLLYEILYQRAGIGHPEVSERCRIAVVEIQVRVLDAPEFIGFLEG